MYGKETNSGVSPVIGVILMVAVTVALVALVTVVVFDIGGDVSDSPDATVQLQQNGEDIEATLLRNENVERLFLQAGQATINGSDDSVTELRTSGDMQSAGDTATLAGTVSGDPANLSNGETVNVIAELSDGSQEVLTSTDYEG